MVKELLDHARLVIVMGGTGDMLRDGSSISEQGFRGPNPKNQCT